MSLDPQSDNSPAAPLTHQGLEVDLPANSAKHEGRILHLTDAEFRLLACLLRQPGQAVTRQHLASALTEEKAIVEERTVDVHIASLRRKIGDADLIETVRKVGYRVRG